MISGANYRIGILENLLKSMWRWNSINNGGILTYDNMATPVKEEEAQRIAAMTRLDLETLESLTSQLSQEDTDTLLEQVLGLMD